MLARFTTALLAVGILAGCGASPSDSAEVSGVSLEQTARPEPEIPGVEPEPPLPAEVPGVEPQPTVAPEVPGVEPEPVPPVDPEVPGVDVSPSLDPVTPDDALDALVDDVVRAEYGALLELSSGSSGTNEERLDRLPDDGCQAVEELGSYGWISVDAAARYADLVVLAEANC